jgi:hypothetical protein
VLAQQTLCAGLWIVLGFQQRREQQSVATPQARERKGSPTLQTLRGPTLLTPLICFRVAAFQTLAERGTSASPNQGVV